MSERSSLFPRETGITLSLFNNISLSCSEKPPSGPINIADFFKEFFNGVNFLIIPLLVFSFSSQKIKILSSGQSNNNLLISISFSILGISCRSDCSEASIALSNKF